MPFWKMIRLDREISTLRSLPHIGRPIFPLSKGGRPKKSKFPLFPARDSPTERLSDVRYFPTAALGLARLQGAPLVGIQNQPGFRQVVVQGERGELVLHHESAVVGVFKAESR